MPIAHGGVPQQSAEKMNNQTRSWLSRVTGSTMLSWELFEEWARHPRRDGALMLLTTVDCCFHGVVASIGNLCELLCRRNTIDRHIRHVAREKRKKKIAFFHLFSPFQESCSRRRNSPLRGDSTPRGFKKQKFKSRFSTKPLRRSLCFRLLYLSQSVIHIDDIRAVRACRNFGDEVSRTINEMKTIANPSEINR